jgi:DNA-binding response OmpR family regulator
MSNHPTRPQILLVEDASDLAAVIAREFEAANYQLTHVTHGETALQLANETEFSLIILDWMLPSINGLDVLRKLRETSAVPVLMLTARDAEFDRVLGLEVGADDYLTKPFSMRELLARVHAMLRRRELIEHTLLADRQRQTDPTVIIVEELRLDPERYTFTVSDEPIDLTRTEFALLHLLVSNAGRVFSRGYLLDTLWGENYIDGDRSVDNTILRLRKKLKTMGGFIETVWGVGYRWKRL